MKGILAVVISCTVLVGVALPAAAETFLAAKDGDTHSNGTGRGYYHELSVANYSSSRVVWLGFDTTSLAVDSVDSITLTLRRYYKSGNYIPIDAYEITDSWSSWSEDTLDNGDAPNAGATAVAATVDCGGIGGGKYNNEFYWTISPDIWEPGKYLQFNLAGSGDDVYSIFYSRDMDDNSHATDPRLEITYSNSNETPEPATAVLLAFGLGASALASRRRKS